MRGFFDPIQLTHAPRFFLVRGQVRPNLEVAARAEAMRAGCQAAGVSIAAPGPFAANHLDAAIAAIHTPAYLAFLSRTPAEWQRLEDAGPEMVANAHPTPEMLADGARLPASVVGLPGWFMSDTACPVDAATYPAARAAAACAIAAADEAAAGRHAYALCRPPGHHAYPARAGGHCYLNNAAIAAERLRALGAARVGVLDIDAHHGNGTQHIFWSRDDVVTVSVHGDPDEYYPWYVGRRDERGGAAGIGCNLNLPLPRGADDAEWLAAIDQGLNLLRRAGVDAMVVSLGFDPSRDEPLTFLAVTDDGFARAGRAIAAFGRPLAIVQEGGYAVPRLAALLARFLGGVTG